MIKVDWKSDRNIQRNKTTEEKFWEKVGIRSEDECWEWQASISKDGYGQFKYNNIMQVAHRIAWIITNGEIPEHDSYHGMCVCHTCDNRKCVNPNHLFLGTHHDKSIMCDVDGCCSTNVWNNIYEWKVGSEIIHLCEDHLDCQPKTPHTKIYPQQKVYGRDK